jgi:3'-5' exoribonuclease
VSAARVARGRGLREFTEGAFPWPLISELTEGIDVRACYIVQEMRRAETKQAKPYLRMVLGDRTGRIDAYVWDDVERWEAACAVEDVVGVEARVASFQDRRQLRIASIERLSAESGDYEHLLPSSARPRELMERELDQLIASVGDAGLRKLLERLTGRDTEIGRAFRGHPAATRNHHAYVSGLLEHTVSIAGSCGRLAEHYTEQGTPIDRDLLVTGAILHDIGKLRELSGFPANAYTTEGKLIGHIVLGMQMVREEAHSIEGLADDRLLLLLHLVASHQGKPEWDSPRVPQTLEALILHHADDLDAKMNQAGAALAGVEPGEWSGYDRSLGSAFFRPGNASPESPPAATLQRDPVRPAPPAAPRPAPPRPRAALPTDAPPKPSTPPQQIEALFSAVRLDEETGEEPDARPAPGTRCPNCGYTNDLGASRCGVCGADLN